MSEQNADILKCIGELVKISGREIIFEGVETVEQEQFLKECGFEYAQGYLCNRPLAVSEFEKCIYEEISVNLPNVLPKT